MAILMTYIRNIRFYLSAQLIVAISFLLLAPMAMANTFTVTNLLDGRDPTAPIPGSLRDALTQAQSGDTVVFSSSLACGTRRVCTIRINYRLNVEAKSLTIQGPGRDALVLDGRGKHIVLYVPGGGVDKTLYLNLSGMTIRNGQAGPEAPTGGGGLVADSLNEVVIDDVVFDSNAATNAGGAIYACCANSLTITNSAFTNNTATNYGGALEALGVRLFEMDNTVFTDNVAGQRGGAINNDMLVDYLSGEEIYGDWHFTNTIITANTANNAGGVRLAGGAEGTVLTIDSLENISGNTCLTHETGCQPDITGGVVIVEEP